LTQATTKPLPCQVRSKPEGRCLHRTVVEVRGVPYCEDCAREQEAYFAIGELTREAQDLRSEPLGKTLGETLEGLRRQRGWPCSGQASPFSARRRNRASRAYEELSKANQRVAGTTTGGRKG
jgi:hypothetical protein